MSMSARCKSNCFEFWLGSCPMMNEDAYFMDHGETDTQNKKQTDIETLALVSHSLWKKGREYL